MWPTFEISPNVSLIAKFAHAGGTAVIVGGGYIGLETAASLLINGDSMTLEPVNDKLAGLNDELQAALGRPLNLKACQRNESCLNLLALLYNQGCLVHHH